MGRGKRGSQRPRDGGGSAGALAANITETGKIGAITGAPVAVIDPFVRGFTAGAGAYDLTVNVMVRYVGESFEGFSMPDNPRSLVPHSFFCRRAKSWFGYADLICPNIDTCRQHRVCQDVIEMAWQRTLQSPA
jgi:hypothetical protein